MQNYRLVNVFKESSRSEAEYLKRINNCMDLQLPSSPWKICWGEVNPHLLPDSLEDIRREMYSNNITNQGILIFESADETYVIVCLRQAGMEAIKLAQLKGSEAAFSWLRDLQSVVRRPGTGI